MGSSPFILNGKDLLILIHIINRHDNLEMDGNSPVSNNGPGH